MKKYSLKNKDGQIFYNRYHQPEGMTYDTYPKDEKDYLTVDEIVEKYGGEQSAKMVQDLITIILVKKKNREDEWRKQGIKNRESKEGARVTFQTFRSYESAKLLNFIDKRDDDDVLCVADQDGILKDLVVAKYQLLKADENGEFISSQFITRLISISKLKEILNNLGYEVNEYLDNVLKTSDCAFNVISIEAVAEKSESKTL